MSLGVDIRLLGNRGMHAYRLPAGITLPHDLPNKNAVPLSYIFTCLRVLGLHESVQWASFATPADGAPSFRAGVQAKNACPFLLTHRAAQGFQWPALDQTL